MEEALKTGRPVLYDKKDTEDLFDEEFTKGMFSLSRGSAETIYSMVDLNKRRKLLDLGGGPGTYSVILCRKNKKLRAVIFDLPKVINIANHFIKKFGMECRIIGEVGDYFKDDLGYGYDAVLVSHIIHLYNMKKVEFLLKKVYSSMLKNGRIIISDFYLFDKERTKPVHNTLFALKMLLFTEKGRGYSIPEVKKMLKDIGFRKIKHKIMPGRSTIVTGVK